MKNTLLGTIALTAAALVSASAPPATNAPTNTNTNANSAKPAAAAPTVDTLLEMDRKANEAYFKGDSTHFDTVLSDKAVMSMGTNRMGKATIVSMIKDVKCEGVTTKVSEPQMHRIDNDTYALTYKNESTGKCNEGKDGAMIDLKPTRASTIWVRNGEKWQAAWHGETPIMGASTSPAANTAANSTAAKPATSSDTKAAAPADTAAKDTAKPAANAAASASPAEPAKLTPSANTEALAKLHLAGWEAFKAKDAKHFENEMSSSFALVAPDGSYVASKADVIKEWIGGGKMKCEGITKVSFTDTFAYALSPTVEILMGKGNSDGTCDGQKNGDLWQNAVYVKEGNAWKIAFMTEQPPMPGM